MCILCIEIAKGKMTSDEAYRAANSGELKIDADHGWELIGKIEAVRKKEEDEMFEHTNKKDYTPG